MPKKDKYFIAAILLLTVMAAIVFFTILFGKK